MLVPDDLGMNALADIPDVHRVRYSLDEPLSAAARAAQVLVPPALVGPRVLDLIPQLPALRYVQLLSAGAEVWVGQLPDGVLLSTCRGAHGGSTAELVMAGLLARLRNVDGFAEDQRAHRWNQHPTDTLQDKRVLVIGAGDLGHQLERRLLAFDAEVTLAGRHARDGVRGMDEVPELLGAHDIVVLMVPPTHETRGLVDAAFLARMPDGALLVNVARGPVVDTDALLAELKSRRLGAILDVTDPEPLPAGHPLWTVQGLTLFPHVGGACRGMTERSWRVAAAEIARYAAGESPKNVVRGSY